LIFTVIGIIAMPALVWLMASGFVGDERFNLAVEYGRLSFPYIFFISLTALVSGVLNGAGRFTAAAAAPVLLNVVFIGGIALSAVQGRPASDALGMGLDEALGLRVGDTLALSVPLGGIAQLALVWWAAHRAGFTLRPGWPRLTPELKRLFVIAAPAALAGGVVQINLLVGRQVASFFDGAVAWLTYADRLYQLPLGVVGVAIGVVLLPDLSRRLRAGDVTGGQDAYSRATELSLALTLPAAVALVVIPGPLISVLFQRGAFTAADTAATALAVLVYGLGLPAFILQKVLQPLFYAREDTRRPFYYAVVSMVVNVALAMGLAPFVGFIAAALGTTLSSWAMVGQLWWGARDMGDAARYDRRFKARIWRIALASCVMGAVLLVASTLLTPLFAMPSVRYLALAGLIGAGAISYFGAGQVLGAFRLQDFRRATRR
jgi:putative peptidoglycan lipid II flippase